MQLGIRGKILLIYVLGFSVIVGVSAVIQGFAYQASTEFETRLNHYHAMQTLRQSVADLRKKSEQFLRSNQAELRHEVDVVMVNIAAMMQGIRILERGAGEIAFRAVAVRRGLIEYHKRLMSCFDEFAAGKPQAYNAFLAADRVADYVDGYLGILLSSSLADGSAWYRANLLRNETMRVVAISVNLLALGVAIVLAYLLANSILRPVCSLARLAERMASGDLDVEAMPASSNDEVAILSRSFSAMSQNIREMVAGLREKAVLEQKLHADEVTLIGMDRDLKEARFLALQSRIRPHFLFNALNTIARNALLEGARETERLSHSLATLMRYSLGEGEMVVSLGEELGIVREYLAFQGIRFGKRLQWDIQADELALSVLVPRLSLQPLVENAVLHGIEPKVSGGKVAVWVRIRRGRVIIRVMDSGCGMGTDTLQKVRLAIRGQLVSDMGIGIAGLDNRLAYCFQDKLQTAVYSRFGEGTLISISVPQGGS